MAPACTRDSTVSMLSAKDKHKLRKPVVEKMRRDRINSCIEQLKVLLEREFHKQDPNAKLEKADVLEMTVVFLKQQLQSPSSHAAHMEGYSQCWKETVHFLSSSSIKDMSLSHLQRLRSPQPLSQDVCPTVGSPLHSHGPVKQPPAPVKSMWRPW
ncbi:transcription factor HES-5-like [Periophthalmus magnuspinnatus]|uniref:transcription factor HES-5-like n=1 Tax=Periophthalmus magnuspinnatus TaxID=409849 RepID=UPI00145AEA78|nr:transcription factor HES-5-like [Periophthalmus magnuspinnatus]XP_033822789.1 transcription factor HES-5-like [Periophthalmus magnuspinnatus]